MSVEKVEIESKEDGRGYVRCLCKVFEAEGQEFREVRDAIMKNGLQMLAAVWARSKGKSPGQRRSRGLRTNLSETKDDLRVFPKMRGMSKRQEVFTYDGGCHENVLDSWAIKSIFTHQHMATLEFTNVYSCSKCAGRG